MNKKITAAIIGSALVLSICTGCIYPQKSKNTPEMTIMSFVDALNHDNIEKMIEYIDPYEKELISNTIGNDSNSVYSSVQKLIKLMPFISYVSDKDFLPEYDIDVISEKIENKTAVEKINATNTDNGQEYTLNVYMIQIENQWYIQYAKFEE